MRIEPVRQGQRESEQRAEQAWRGELWTLRRRERQALPWAVVACQSMMPLFWHVFTNLVHHANHETLLLNVVGSDGLFILENLALGKS